jgi:hypothetical protein
MPTSWKNRIVRREDVAPDQLLANPFNFRTHSRFQQDSMLAIMREVGWVQDVVVNVNTGHVVDGHMRIMLAMRESEPTVPVVFVDLTTDEEKLILATYDYMGSLAGIDRELFDQLLLAATPEDNNLIKLLNGLNPKRQTNPIGEEITEEKISPEMFERQDYLVIAFDDQFDWQMACTFFGVEMVTSQPVGRRNLRQKGLSRVITGKDFLRRVNLEVNDTEQEQLAHPEVAQEGEESQPVGT